MRKEHKGNEKRTQRKSKNQMRRSAPSADKLLEIWANSPSFSVEIRQRAQEVQRQGASHAEYDYFTQEMFFGTGGVRGIIGAGSGRINYWTLGRLTHALSLYLKNLDCQKQPIVIVGHDTRHLSREFAISTAKIFAHHGIRVQLFAKPCATPLLSYAVLHLEANAGIMITASHNPKNYNGYKVYQDDGAQIIGSVQKKIEEVWRKLSYHELSVVPVPDEKSNKFTLDFSAPNQEIRSLGDELFAAYCKEMFTALGSRASFEFLGFSKSESSSAMPVPEIVYSPLHGSGEYYIPQVLHELGVQVHLVKEQTGNPNGAFATVEVPNPEEAKAMQMAGQMAREKKSSVFCATDPDVDRLGVGIVDSTGKSRLLTGNQIGSIFCAYLCDRLQQRIVAEKLPPRRYVFFKSIVTTDLQTNIVHAYSTYGFEMRNVLTGFKYIAEGMNMLVDEEQFILGSEESFGYLPIDFIRDKDAISATVLFAEIMREWGDDLEEILAKIYLRFGFYLESLVSIEKSGILGQKEIANIMDFLRQGQVSFLGQKIAGRQVVLIRDYQNRLIEKRNEGSAGGKKSRQKDAQKDPINNKGERELPRSNVIEWQLAPEGKITIRPSGTEPKIKIYVSLRHAEQMHSIAQIRKERPLLENELKSIETDFLKILNIC